MHSKFVSEMSNQELSELIGSNNMNQSEWARKYLLVFHKDTEGVDYHPLSLVPIFHLRVVGKYSLSGIFLATVGCFFAWVHGSFSLGTPGFWTGFQIGGLLIVGGGLFLCWPLSSREKIALAHFRDLLMGVELVAGERFTILLTRSERQVRAKIESWLVMLARTLLELQDEIKALNRDSTSEEERKLADAKKELERYHSAVRFTGLADKEWTRYFTIAQEQLDEEAAKPQAYDVMAGCER